jgi:hypothetical protein
MPRKSNDPIKATTRRSKVERRLGEAQSCAQCGESRLEALVARSRPRLCQECYSQRRGLKKTEAHHIAGKSNSPVTIEVPANVHRAALSVSQYEWPPQTLANPDGSPLLRAAGALRGVADLLVDLIVGLISLCAVGLELIDDVLHDKLGEKWWLGTAVADWRPV